MLTKQFLKVMVGHQSLNLVSTNYTHEGKYKDNSSCQTNNNYLRLFRQSIELTPSLSVSLKIHVPSTSSNVQLAGVSPTAKDVNNPTTKTIPNHKDEFDMM